MKPEDNRVLGACAAFEGDVLLVECENDTVIPHPTIASYRVAFENAHSLTYRVIEGADHGLSEEPWQQAYTSLLVTWATEMVLGGGRVARRRRCKPMCGHPQIVAGRRRHSLRRRKIASREQD